MHCIVVAPPASYMLVVSEPFLPTRLVTPHNLGIITPPPSHQRRASINTRHTSPPTQAGPPALSSALDRFFRDHVSDLDLRPRQQILRQLHGLHGLHVLRFLCASPSSSAHPLPHRTSSHLLSIADRTRHPSRRSAVQTGTRCTRCTSCTNSIDSTDCTSCSNCALPLPLHLTTRSPNSTRIPPHQHH